MREQGKPAHYTEYLGHLRPGSWNNADVPLAQRGVRLSWLHDLIESITWYANEPIRRAEERYQHAENQRRASIWLDHVPWPEYVPLPPKRVAYTTRELVAQYIVPLTDSLKAPLYALAPDEARGSPTVFISHAWDAHAFIEGHSFGTLDAVEPRGIAGIKEEFVWIDIASYNQHTFEAIASDMESVIKSIGKVAFTITPIPLLDRVWCLWELLCAARLSEADFQFCAAPGYRMDKRIMVNDFFESFTSVQLAKATKEEDRRAILSSIKHHFGSFAAADSYIINLMRRELGQDWFELYPKNRGETH